MLFTTTYDLNNHEVTFLKKNVLELEVYILNIFWKLAITLGIPENSAPEYQAVSIHTSLNTGDIIASLQTWIIDQCIPFVCQKSAN